MCFFVPFWERVDCGDNEDFDIYGKSDRDIRKDIANIDVDGIVEIINGWKTLYE